MGRGATSNGRAETKRHGVSGLGVCGVWRGRKYETKNNSNSRTAQPDRQQNRRPRCRTTIEIARVCWDSWTFWSCGGDISLGKMMRQLLRCRCRCGRLRCCLLGGLTDSTHYYNDESGARNDAMPYPNDQVVCSGTTSSFPWFSLRYLLRL